MKIEFVREEDAARLSEIYAPYVRDTWGTFEVQAPSAAEISKRIRDYTQSYPWVVALDPQQASRDQQIVGYAYASAFRTRVAYQWSCEVSVYIDEGARAKGIGSQLYRELFDLLERQGRRNAFAVIGLPNDASVHFHEKFGFEAVGILRDAGHKLGAWRDVGLWQKRFQIDPGAPSAPRDLSACVREWEAHRSSSPTPP